MRPSHIVLVSLLAFVPFMAAWRESHADVVGHVVKAMRCALGGADLSEKEAAAAAGMDPALWARVREQGGNLAALLIVANEHADFRRELRRRLFELLEDRREVIKCERVTRSGSSSAA